MEPVLNVLPPLTAPQPQPETATREAPAGAPPRANVERAHEISPREEEAETARDAVPLERRLEQINRLTKHLSFLYHKPTDTVQIRVADGSGRLVREIPSDEFLRTMERLHGNAGAILDDRA